MNVVKEFQEKSGYTFKDRDLLMEALTHPSALGKRESRGLKKKNYERLEFLGDSVLSMIIAEFLIKQYKNESEGNISKRHTALVCGSTLAKIAKRIDIPSMIIMSKGEESSGGRENEHILENVVESLVGAIYLDGGLEESRKFIHRFWRDMALKNIQPPRDPKTELQEMSQAYNRSLPIYELVEQRGTAHEPLFVVKVKIEGKGEALGEGKSKKEAEKKAAIKMVRLLKLESKHD